MNAPDLSPPVQIVLVRHGVTEFTTSGRLDGRGGADPQLSAEGLRQASAAARALAARRGEFSAGGIGVVTSSLRRARQTGGAIADALGVAVEVEPDLDEMAFGDWDGRSLGEILREDPQALTRSRVDDVPPDGGETYADLRRRVLPVLERVVAAAHDGGPRTVIAVTHHGPIAVALADVLGLDLESAWRLAVDPASFTTLLRWRDGGVVVTSVNDAAHLR